MDSLLLETIKRIDENVSDIRKDQVGFQLKSTERLATLEARMQAHDERLHKLERHPVRRWTAKRWATVTTGVLGVFAGLFKYVLGLKHPA